jgi:hypothetical protein
MLGELLYKLNDIHIVNQRIIDSTISKLETTITATGIFRDVPITETTTFWTMPLKSEDNKVLYGEANGILSARNKHNNEDVVVFRGHGLTFKLNNGKIRDRGFRIYQIKNIDADINLSKGKLSSLNNIIGLFEYDIDKNKGLAELKIWEWK